MSSWQCRTAHNSTYKVIEEGTLRDHQCAPVQFLNKDGKARVPGSGVRPLNSKSMSTVEAENIGHLAATAKVPEVHDVVSLWKSHPCQRFLAEALWLLGVVNPNKKWGFLELGQYPNTMAQTLSKLRQGPCYQSLVEHARRGGEL